MVCETKARFKATPVAQVQDWLYSVCTHVCAVITQQLTHITCMSQTGQHEPFKDEAVKQQVNHLKTTSVA